MGSASSETGEEKTPLFLSSTANSNIEWLSLGKSDMIGCIVTAGNSRYVRQCALMERKDDLSFKTVYCS